MRSRISTTCEMCIFTNLWLGSDSVMVSSQLESIYLSKVLKMVLDVWTLLHTVLRTHLWLNDTNMYDIYACDWIRSSEEFRHDAACFKNTRKFKQSQYKRNWQFKTCYSLLYHFKWSLPKIEKFQNMLDMEAHVIIQFLDINEFTCHEIKFIKFSAKV